MQDRLSLEDLKKAAEEKIKKRRADKIQILICYTSCSICTGADEVLKSMQDMLAYSNIDNVVIETVGCLGICSKEPLIDVYMPDGTKYSYENVDPIKAQTILLSHSKLGEPVEEYLLKA